MPRIPNAYLRPLQDALLDAYPSEELLAMMLQFELEKVLKVITKATSIRAQIFELLQESQREGWTTDLVEAARRDASGNEKLRTFAETLAQVATSEPTQGGSPSTPLPTEKVDLNLPPDDELESIIKAAYGFVELDWWIAQLQTIGKQVCRIGIHVTNNRREESDGYGTGFLVGPDMVLTNYHVVEPVILGERNQATSKGWWARRQDVTLKFDYKKLADRETINPGVDVALAAEGWLIDSSFPSDLDYALLRLAEPVGNERGWINLSEGIDLEAQMPLFIVQHPNGRPIQLALDKVLEWKERPNRVRYTTNTEPGSSGSPCFTAKWELVALHHVGEGGDKPTYNQGISISHIVRQWKRNGVWEKFIQEPPPSHSVSTRSVEPSDVMPPKGNGEQELSTNQGGTVATPLARPSLDLQRLIAGLNRQKLLNILLRLNDGEFRMLLAIFDKIEYDHLGGDNTGRKTLELVLWAERHNSFAELIEVAHTLYPNLEWKV